jgi:hypothetical protein
MQAKFYRTCYHVWVDKFLQLTIESFMKLSMMNSKNFKTKTFEFYKKLIYS